MLGVLRIRIDNYGITAGKVADLVMIDCQSATEAIASAPGGRTVIKQGRVVSTSQRVQQFVNVG